MFGQHRRKNARSMTFNGPERHSNLKTESVPNKHRFLGSDPNTESLREPSSYRFVSASKKGKDRESVSENQRCSLSLECTHATHHFKAAHEADGEVREKEREKEWLRGPHAECVRCQRVGLAAIRIASRS